MVLRPPLRSDQSRLKRSGLAALVRPRPTPTDDDSSGGAAVVIVNVRTTLPTTGQPTANRPMMRAAATPLRKLTAGWRRRRDTRGSGEGTLHAAQAPGRHETVRIERALTSSTRSARHRRSARRGPTRCPSEWSIADGRGAVPDPDRRVLVVASAPNDSGGEQGSEGPDRDLGQSGDDVERSVVEHRLGRSKLAGQQG